jgi:hypothetical protein
MANCCTPIIDDTIVTKLIPYVIGPSIVILLFIIGRLLDSKVRLREIRRNWYMKVIIDPNIEKLELFYENIQDTIKKSIEGLVPKQTVVTMAEYLVLKSTEMGTFQNLKRKFETQFISLVQTNYPEISNELEDLLRDLEDQITSYLDRSNLALTHLDEIESIISGNHYSLIKILYKPLSFTGE